MKIFISSLIIIMTSTMLAMGFLLNPTIITITPVFSQRDSVYSTRSSRSKQWTIICSSIHQHANKSMVSWTNDDLIQHTVTSDEEGLFASGPISPGMIW